MVPSGVCQCAASCRAVVSPYASGMRSSLVRLLPAAARSRLRAVQAQWTTLDRRSSYRALLRQAERPGPVGLVSRWCGRRYGWALPGGARLIIDRPSEWMQSLILKQGAYEPEIVALSRQHIVPGQLFVDVGANQGQHSVIAARAGATVHAFEPVPRLADRVRDNAKLNGVSERLVVFGTGLGATVGTARLYENGRLDDGSHSLLAGIPAASVQTHEIAVTTLDEHLFSQGLRPRLVKIDVEGYEAAVLDGAERTLASARPMVIIETGDRLTDQLGESARSVLARLVRAGYRLHRIHANRPLEQITLDAVTGELANYWAVAA